MVDRVQFRVEGAAEIERAMKELGSRAANRIARSALNKSGTVLVRAARRDRPRHRPDSVLLSWFDGAPRRLSVNRRMVRSQVACGAPAGNPVLDNMV